MIDLEAIALRRASALKASNGGEQAFLTLSERVDTMVHAFDRNDRRREAVRDLAARILEQERSAADVPALIEEVEGLRAQVRSLNDAIRLWGQTGRTDHLAEAIVPEAAHG